MRTIMQVLRCHSMLVALACTIGTSGCVSHIDTLREAERTFSRAADMENRERFGDEQAGSSVDSYTSSYRIVVATLQKLITEKSQDLGADRLLCTAHTLRVLALWRLGERDNAVRGARDGLDGACAPTGNQPPPPRDRAMLVALPGLVRIDEASGLLAKRPAAKAPPEERERAYRRIAEETTQAIGFIDDAERDLTPDHPLRGYLAVSRMGGVRIRQIAATNLLFGTQGLAAEENAIIGQAQMAWDGYRRYIQCRPLIPDQANDSHRGVQRWKRALGGVKETDIRCE